MLQYVCPHVQMHVDLSSHVCVLTLKHMCPYAQSCVELDRSLRKLMLVRRLLRRYLLVLFMCHHRRRRENASARLVLRAYPSVRV